MGGHDRLTPEGKRFYAEVAKLTNSKVFVGFQSGHKPHTKHRINGKVVETGEGVDMAEIAMFNELGTSTSPPRPFLRMTVDENQDKISAMCEAEAKKLANGGSAEQGLKRLGAFGVSLVQEKIGNGSFTPNAPATVKAKKSDKPLIDTGQMRQSVHYVIRHKDGSTTAYELPRAKGGT